MDVELLPLKSEDSQKKICEKGKGQFLLVFIKPVELLQMFKNSTGSDCFFSIICILEIPYPKKLECFLFFLIYKFVSFPLRSSHIGMFSLVKTVYQWLITF